MLNIRMTLKTIKCLRNVRTFSLQSDNMQRYVGKSISVRGKTIDLVAMRKREWTERRQQQHDPDSIRIKSYDAFAHLHRGIADEILDEHFIKLSI